MPDKNSITGYGTKKDRDIFFKLIDREIGYKTKATFDIQKIINREKTNCKYCEENADYRIVKDMHKTYSINVCHNCIQEKTENWLQQRLNQLKEHLDRYKTAEAL